MVQLFLDDTELIIDSSQSIKIIRENPYLTLSDSYTLDIGIPLDFYQNRQFFRNIQRIDVRKEHKEFSGRLISGNRTLLSGTARITQSTESIVKVQITSGVSALKMTAEQEGKYIDNIPIGNLNSTGGGLYNFDAGGAEYDYADDGYWEGCYMPLLDTKDNQLVNATLSIISTVAGVIVYNSACPKLTFVAKQLAAYMGYDLDLSALPAVCDNIHIVTSIQGNVEKKLPHWTVKEFFREFQNFFGCTIIANGDRKLKLVSLNNFVDNPHRVIDVVSEFQNDFSEEDDAGGIFNKNISYDMESSDMEIVDEDMLALATQTRYFAGEAEMIQAFNADTEYGRMRTIYILNGEKYIGWQDDKGGFSLQKVAPFNALKRSEDADEVSLKIVPACMKQYDGQISKLFDYDHAPVDVSFYLPAVSTPYGLCAYWQSNASDPGTTPTLQSIIGGEETVASQDDKSDVINVVFYDRTREETINFQGSNYYIKLGFTDANFKKNFSNNREKWSFSLNELQGFSFYLGQLHQTSFQCSRKVRLTAKFLSDDVPDPTNIFVIHNKLFACEKVEADIEQGEMLKLMTGYFREIL